MKAQPTIAEQVPTPVPYNEDSDGLRNLIGAVIRSAITAAVTGEKWMTKGSEAREQSKDDALRFFHTARFRELCSISGADPDTIRDVALREISRRKAAKGADPESAI